MQPDPYATPQSRDRPRGTRLLWALIILLATALVMTGVIAWMQYQIAIRSATQARMEAERQRAIAEESRQQLEFAREQQAESSADPTE